MSFVLLIIGTNHCEWWGYGWFENEIGQSRRSLLRHWVRCILSLSLVSHTHIHTHTHTINTLNTKHTYPLFCLFLFYSLFEWRILYYWDVTSAILSSFVSILFWLWNRRKGLKSNQIKSFSPMNIEWSISYTNTFYLSLVWLIRTMNPF
jgi:hypothetical protein